MTPPRAGEDATWPDWLGDPRARGVRGHRRTQPVVAPAGGRRPRAQRPAHGHLHRHGVREVALLPAARRCRPSSPRRGPKGQRGASVLYLAPTKALAQDQLAALRRLGLPGLRCTTHDGDSTPELREWTRDHAEYVLTNPDMLHRSLLPGHARWSRFFALAPLRRGRRVPPLPRGLRRPRRPDPAAAAAGRGAVRRPPDVRAGLGDRRRAGGLGRPAHRPRGRRRHRRRLAPGPHGAGAVGAAVRARTSARTALPYAAPPPARSPTCSTDLVVERVRTLAFIRSRRGAETVALTARRLLGEVDAAPGRPGRGLPRRLPARGAPRARGGAAGRAAARAGRDQRARARHRHQRARRRAARRLPRHPRGAVAAGRPRRAGRARRARRCWSRATTRWTPTWSTTPRPCSASRSRPTSSTPTTPTCSARTCARPRRSRR